MSVNYSTIIANLKKDGLSVRSNKEGNLVLVDGETEIDNPKFVRSLLKDASEGKVADLETLGKMKGKLQGVSLGKMRVEKPVDSDMMPMWKESYPNVGNDIDWLQYVFFINGNLLLNVEDDWTLLGDLSNKNEVLNNWMTYTTKNPLVVHKINSHFYETIKRLNAMAAEQGMTQANMEARGWDECSQMTLRFANITARGNTVDTEDGNKVFIAESFFLKDFNFAQFIIDNKQNLAPYANTLDKMPRCVANNGIPAFHHINLDKFNVEGDISAWDEWLSKYDEDTQKVFRAFVWSIVDCSNEGNQMLYMYDEGQTGKSTMLNALANVIGEECVCSIQKDSLNNQFGLAKVWDKRLIIIGDNKNPMIIRSERVHQITGGDWCDVERKGESSFSAKLNCKMIVGSNVLPEITRAFRNEDRRLILMRPKSDWKPNESMLFGDSAFKRKLEVQALAFVSSCRKDYEELCKGNCDIDTTRIDWIKDLCSDDNSAYLQDLLSKDFAFGYEYRIKSSDLQTWCKEKDLDHREITQVLTRIFKCNKVRTSSGVYYTGITTKKEAVTQDLARQMKENNQ